MEPQSLAMTRSIGDFYHQRYGVTWEPEVCLTDVASACEEHGSSSLVLVVASDGVWDHWPFDQAIAELVPSGGGSQANFGESVAIDGTTIAVGAYTTDVFSTNDGAVFVLSLIHI